ncbi:MAG: DUF2642 domain-containing protein, partial [Clostridia bacterium]|nr:DUF2642 domain-containing protein [Clostridia bacterium]
MSNLDYLVGKNVDIHKTGPGLFSGKILDVKSDYLVIKSKNDEIYYINLYHIHKIVEDDTRVSPPSDNTKEFFEANNFSSLLKNLTGQKICFNNGPEGFTGIIKEVDRDFLKCEEKGKTSCIFIFHIRCFKTSIPKQDSPKIID